MKAHFLSRGKLSSLRDPGEFALKNGELQILPHSFWRGYTQEEIALFCNKNAFYCVPTAELLYWLMKEIDGRRAIEIGSGNGVLARALGVTALRLMAKRVPLAIRASEKETKASSFLGITMAFGTHLIGT